MNKEIIDGNSVERVECTGIFSMRRGLFDVFLNDGRVLKIDKETIPSLFKGTLISTEKTNRQKYGRINGVLHTHTDKPKEETWSELKARGSIHYRTGGVQPIDLYRDLGIFRDFAIGSIIKYAARNIACGPDAPKVNASDMKKIIHYAQLIIAEEDPVNRK